MLQIRITNADGSDPIILELAENKSHSKSLNTPNEGVQFEIAKNSPKADVLNPEITGYKKFCEIWDTKINRRLNRGPITSIEENGPNWKVSSAGRSALLNDYFKSKKTYYQHFDEILDDLRYENIAIEPRASTFVGSTDTTANATTVFGTLTVDSKYAGLSLQSKDFAIDDNTGRIKPNQLEPPNSHWSASEYWTGMSTKDTIILDLGGSYPIKKVGLSLPWWGGTTIQNNRTYDVGIDYAVDGTNKDIVYKGHPFNSPLWTQIYDSGDNNQLGYNSAMFYLGSEALANNLALEDEFYYQLTGVPGPIDMRYVRVRIRDVHAWYGNALDGTTATDGYSYECDPTYVAGTYAPAGSHEGVLHGKTISERVIEPQNDCHASVLEIGAYQEIMPKDIIRDLILQRIDNNNQQITYYHAPQSTDTTTTTDGFRKYEPGGFFRKFWVTWTGATSTYQKFYSSDCANCYPDGFSFGIMDQNNSMIYSSDSAAGTDVVVKAPALTRQITMKGAPNAYISYVDSWPAVTDPLSWGGSYSYNDRAGDTATIHFRGQSFKWYATVPSDKTGANVRIEIRSKPDGSTFGSFSTLVSSMPLASNITNIVVYEITYESGILQPNTVYEIRLTNLDGGYMSIDSIEGYWAASMTDYNEDSHRLYIRHYERTVQIYDKRFSGGSMYKMTGVGEFSFVFEGDRVIIYSAKGNNHGIMRIGISDASDPSNNKYGNYNARRIPIPGGDAFGNLHVNLDTGKRGNEVPQYIAFDSNDYFPDGLKWGRYAVGIYMSSEDLQQFTTTNVAELDSFVPRCSDCTPPLGDTVSVNKPIFIDGIAAHETVGFSVQFENDSHLDILKSLTDAAQVEWDITDEGLRIEPRIGNDTNEVLREGQNTLVSYSIVNDMTQIASMLISTGADIDGLPLFAITEDKDTRADLGRTVMRKEDFRDISDYFQLVGVSRTSLRKRKKSEKRIQVTHIAESLNLEHGDSFILYTKKMGPIRVRINTKTRNESSSNGTSFDLECVRWPQII